MSSASPWLEYARGDQHRQTPDSQRVIDIFESLVNGDTSAEEAALEISTTLEPLIKENPDALQRSSVWITFCEIVRVEGSNQRLSRRLTQFLEALGKMELKDGNGELVKHESGGRYWTDLPTFAMSFKEHGIGVKPDQGMDLDEWAAQSTAYLNATTFAAIALATSPGLGGMSSYISPCMSEGLESTNEKPGARYRTKLYVPAASAWILVAGRKVFELCKGKAVHGLSLQKWGIWRRRFEEIAREEGVEDSVRNDAKRAAEEMKNIFPIS